jgi:hypothetical protein
MPRGPKGEKRPADVKRPPFARPLQLCRRLVPPRISKKSLARARGSEGLRYVQARLGLGVIN